VGYGQNDDARRDEERRRADEARRNEELRMQERQRQEQEQYERRKADDDRRQYERKLETERQNRAYADRKSEEAAESDARYRQSQNDADREHRASEDAYHQNLKQQQDRFRAQENERFEQERQEKRPPTSTGHPWVDDPAFGGLLKLGFICLVVWAVWAGLGKFRLFTQQWDAYDIPLRWIGQFYRTVFDIPLNTIVTSVGANMDSVAQIADSPGWLIGAGVVVVIVALMVLGMLATSKFARRLVSIGVLLFLTPALLGALWLLLPPDSAASARAWIKSQAFYTAQVNGAEIDASVVELANWLACSTYQQPAFPAIAVTDLVRGKVLVSISSKEPTTSDVSPRVTVYRPFKPDFSLAGQVVREIRVTEGAKPTSLEVDFIGKPIRVAPVNMQNRLPVVFYPDGPDGGKIAYTNGHSGYRESPKGRVVGYENVLRVEKSGFTVKCPG
jgi:hypothetical protein